MTRALGRHQGSGLPFRSFDELVSWVCKSLCHPDGRQMTRDEAAARSRELTAKNGPFRFERNGDGMFTLRRRAGAAKG